MGTNWELKRNIVRTHWEPRKNEKKSFQHPPPQNLKGHNKARHLECMLWPFPIGCMKFVFSKEFITIFGLG
jgi:hypothetical protein